ncbi:RNA polymerase sigma-70 factor [Aquimarina sp. AD10]|uniref:RNA polymerase subunit sigma-70 n=1 Tax=Aquimarina aggregata TaxID=1642818 RepID=A0A162X7M4_9FLAO|nr:MULTISPECIES: RNA polymerase sigma-70 factor [Aquimarina]AXT60467.1 RNA polymerase sigma-70 factor [Aquimarina sp. AD10]KZS38469.1 RNA polymerase subunit sigma-70 [Aquimarina aggregata]RKM96952.1 RNA polymerase sigma-70 factor [Aquimarina sp. AD10]
MPNNKKSTCDERAFDEFFKSHSKLLRNYVYYKFGDLQQAEDIVQDAFIKLWHNCSKVPLDKAKSYVYTIATNLGISDTRHQKVRFKYKDYITQRKSDVNNESPEFIALEKEYMETLKNAIAELPERQREVFLLSRIDKKTYREIAELSNVSVKAIEKLMHKALVTLRKKIGNI